MTYYYTVDRLGTLKPGAIIELQKLNDLDPSELQDHADRLFPNGFSRFGDGYFVSRWPDPNTIQNPIIELVWEYVRRHVNPDAPSRFESLFAAASIAEAELFRTRLGGAGRIVEVEADEAFRADMDLLAHRPDSIIVMSAFAERYWQGTTFPGRSPTWEYLLRSPVSVVRFVGAPERPAHESR